MGGISVIIWIILHLILGISVVAGNSDLAWGVEAEGDDEGDDDTDEEKCDNRIIGEPPKNDFDTLPWAKTMAMVEMEVEAFPTTDTKSIDCSSLADVKQQNIHLPCAEGQLPVPISFLNFKKFQKQSPGIIRFEDVKTTCLILINLLIIWH